MSFSIIRRTVLLWAKTRRGGLAAILQNTCVARTEKMVKKHSKRKITLKVEIHGQKPTTSEAIQAYGKGIITFSAEKPNTCPMRTDFFLNFYFNTVSHLILHVNKSSVVFTLLTSSYQFNKSHFQFTTRIHSRSTIMSFQFTILEKWSLRFAEKNVRVFGFC